MYGLFRPVLFVLFCVLLSPLAQASDMVYEDPNTIFEGSMKDHDTQSDHWSDQWRVTANTAYADVIMDFDENLTSKSIDQLIFRKNQIIDTRKVYISGIFKGSYLAEWTNTENAFPILTRFPDHASGKSSSDFFFDNASIAVTVTPTEWITLFGQLEYHENHFESQDPLQLRKIYATFGDLNRSPLFFSFGRKTIKFGDFDAYTPFTHNINNHFFRAESDGPIAELGFINDNFHLVATAISGGRHLRTADSSDKDQIENFAIDGDVLIPVAGGKLKVGAGYMHGTIYNHTLPHHPGPEIDCPVTPGQQGVPKCRGRNAAWDIRAEYTSERFDLMAEYTATVDPWPATNQELKAWTVQGRYKTEVFDRKTHFSLSYSRSDIGPFSTGGPGAPVFDEIEQIIGGMEMFINPNFSWGIEYSHNTGFAPLINITTVAKDAESDQLAIGGRVVF